MTTVISCVGCWLAGTIIVLALMLSLRMRRFLRDASPPVPWWAILMLFGIAASWPLLVLAAIAEPFVVRYGRRSVRKGMR